MIDPAEIRRAEINRDQDRLNFMRDRDQDRLNFMMFPMMGTSDAIRQVAQRRGRHWYRGTAECSAVFDSS
jgi:hypothetical protein